MAEQLIAQERIDDNTIRRYYGEDGAISEQILQDVDPLLNVNQALRNAGYDKKALIRKVASIPVALIEEWKVLYGFDWNTASPAEKRAILNSPEYAYLKTTEEVV